MKNKSGFLIVEVLLAIVILSMVFLTLFTILSFATNRTERSKFDSQAAGLLQQGIEVSRTSVLANWGSTTAGNYYPVLDQDNGGWVLIKGNESVLQGRFTRVITVSSVCRVQQGGLQTPCPGAPVDSKSKMISVKITWKEANLDKEVEGSLLLFNNKTS